MYNILDKVNSFKDIKTLDYEQLDMLSMDIRKFLIENISKTGGHLASNLGVVELTISLYRVFDLDIDKVIWDVSHQSYVHKILTGRKDKFPTLRQHQGLSGFLKKSESKYDFFEAGHSSTSISAGVGMARARDLKNEKFDVVSIIGDGALSGGMAFEALNDVGFRKSKMIIILNDNEMSISKNVGSISNILNDLRVNPKYNTIKHKVRSSIDKIPHIGKKISNSIVNVKSAVKQVVLPDMIFEDMGLHYFGPIDGHNIKHLDEILEDAKKLNEPVLIHVITKKGKGYKPAENNPDKFHGIGKFDVITGETLKKSTPTYSSAVGDALIDIAKEDEKVVAITAAMPKGTGLGEFSKKFENRFFDVGIAEQHATTMAAGMASEGLKPFFAVYSTFLQRAFDQILHDICLQKLPVVLGIDRAGIVGDDGETHQGVFDISYLTQIPNMTIVAPKKIGEVNKILRWAFNHNAPVAIRYPRGGDYDEINEIDDISVINDGKWEIIKEGKDIAIISNGRLLTKALEAWKILNEKGINASLINGLFIKPLDTHLLDELKENFNMIVTVEDNVLRGGFGESILSYLNKDHDKVKVLNLGFPDEFIEHGNIEILYEKYDLHGQGIASSIERALR
ncbi:1-deoxy-D-xylulose-5-phosphate synthase [Oceanirhabdus sp. W0125-5]|uniref:1-deoxy-D-xylulose-5-phosphate synthase n=1 Tax=Oceanirhabdus sp. W0125-5 TaxID=2999116 RepID=UPI0022F2C0AB|nr:1-deoxy-D-xylulose-5-phosphate synthase [Oceanirhabdus sp. W0125-5]WBW95321.1 1-deoxy-D-xylulose-5-phosphate synthase [Oceanirhabdus sp. W0125-5]